MRYTIITPTIQRRSLIDTCASVNTQSCGDWEHIVMIDCVNLDNELVNSIQHPQRQIRQCDIEHKNGGNTCRYNAWELAKGEYIYYLDDDNFLADDGVLEDMKIVTDNWALFPIWRLRQKFFHDPPIMCSVDTANLLVKRDIGRWLNVPNYESDGMLVEELKKHTYQSFRDFRPITVIKTR
jgi:glycosyltransferase involved in cell wall biosynthesis